MIKLGIIGAENTHSHCIAAVCNKEKGVPLRVTHIWGETRAAAEDSARQGDIPQVVENWQDLLGQVDGVMIDQRNGRDHYEAAEFFIRHRVPTFVDKPMTATLDEARKLFQLARQKNTPLCTFGLIPLQKKFRQFLRHVAKAGDIQAVNTSGPADIRSPHGGVSFYGFHHVEAIVEFLGTEALTCHLQSSGRNGVGTITFSGGRFATMNFFAEREPFHWRVCAGKKVWSLDNEYDPSIYLPSAKVIHRFLAKGEVPWTPLRMMTPLAILDALRASEKSGKPERVARPGTKGVYSRAA